ncbi:hypothetical protein N7474_008982 [Penicillium riverlandense]|uniref:uncharacterized protein n=1 Tax=Penicillium riverlandense TaxID=1903569 RepID=UPI0025489424|nr:uncharacterized protein N7474_008982 [Penicillium riverlandense]KAJ5812681.1 hypothetical protein N7474_008982 [Penicillium riverlandense]
MDCILKEGPVDRNLAVRSFKAIDRTDTGRNASTSSTHIQAYAEATLVEARKRYFENNNKSHAVHQQALACLPGGNTRTALYSSPFPLSMVSGTCFTVTDEDGHKYTDLVGEFSAGLYGHSEPTIRDALGSALNHIGLNLGAHTKYEVEYASLICSRFGFDRVRFCNSGTEANINAIMAARYFTRKRKVVAFTGGYHGGVLSFRDKPAANTINDTDFVVVEYNNPEAATAAIEGDPHVGAVLVEAMQGASGCILGRDEFLHAVQASTRKVGAVLILDEVLTSRLAPGGLQSILGLQPDITTLGKYLGGGLAFGAFGGRKEIMDVFDPRASRSLPHSGTFNNNTLTMRAGYIGLSSVYTPDKAVTFNCSGEILLTRLQELCKGTQCCWTGRGSLLASHFTQTGSEDIVSISDLRENECLKELFWLEMMEDGFWTTRRGSVAIILGTPQAELDRFLSCVEQFLLRHRDIVALPRGHDPIMRA